MNTALGKKIRSYRQKKNYSQQQLGSILSVDRSTVANWESGRRQPDAVTLSSIADVLGVSLLFLLGSATTIDPINVILVDNEEIILKGNSLIIEKAIPEATVRGFSNSSEALSFAKENETAIAFLETEIGDTSGIDLCHDLLSINPNINIIFLTAHMEYSFDAWSTGACGFLLKPPSVDAIEEQLNKLRYPIFRCNDQ